MFMRGTLHLTLLPNRLCACSNNVYLMADNEIMWTPSLADLVKFRPKLAPVISNFIAPSKRDALSDFEHHRPFEQGLVILRDISGCGWLVWYLLQVIF